VSSGSFVTVRAYRDVVDAEVARAVLEAGGVDAIVVDDDLVAVQWQYSLAIGGVKVQVDVRDLGRAEALLREDRSAEAFRSAGIPGDEDAAERCPACGAASGRSHRSRRRWAAAAYLTGLPLLLGRRGWRCEACHHGWSRPGTPARALSPTTLEAEARVRGRREIPFILLAWATIWLALVLGVWHGVRGDDPGPKPCAGSVSECDARARAAAGEDPIGLRG